MKRYTVEQARDRAELTQAQLAAKIGKPQSFISKIENGTIREPRWSVVVALARALKIQPTQLRFEAAA